MSKHNGVTISLLDPSLGNDVRQWAFPLGSMVQIGRGRENDVRLADARVSRSHAIITHNGQHWIYSSFGRNGSFHDGRRIAARTLEDGDTIECGGPGATLRFSFPAEVAGQPPDLPISDWLKRFHAEQGPAADILWQHYFPRVVELARTRLARRHRRVADEEDVAVSVFDSLYFGLADGRYPELSNAEDLWRLLFVITIRKCIDRVQHDRRQKRGGGKVRGESVFLDDSEHRLLMGLAAFEGSEPAPELAAQLIEETESLLNRLPDQQLRDVARMKLEGQSLAEIAAALGCSLRTVQRRLEEIRDRVLGTDSSAAE